MEGRRGAERLLQQRLTLGRAVAQQKGFPEKPSLGLDLGAQSETAAATHCVLAGALSRAGIRPKSLCAYQRKHSEYRKYRTPAESGNIRLPGSSPVLTARREGEVTCISAMYERATVNCPWCASPTEIHRIARPVVRPSSRTAWCAALRLSLVWIVTL
jgi:hypothetical protein